LSVLLVVVTMACQKGAEEAGPPKEEQTTFPPPKWKADDSGKYPATMTAVVALPIVLQGNMLAGDELAAFVNGECRGEGVVVKVGMANLYFVLVRGLAEEQNPVVFKYYSAKSRYMYETGPVVNFLIDDVYGTAESPKLLSLRPVN
jgi:hypothetical protein